MNKLFILLALASFALLACSEEVKEKTHTELCANGPTKECLTGKWNFIEVENPNCSANDGILSLNEDGSFEAAGSAGYWELTSKTGMKIKCTVTCKEVDEYDVTIKLQGSGLRITNKGFPSFFGDCASNNVDFTEVYSWYGSN